MALPRYLHPAGFLLALLVAAAPARALGRQDTTTVRPLVRGTVLDEQSGRPVAGAVVRLLGGDGATLRSAASDRAGRFSLEGPSPGVYGLRAERIGYAPRDVASLALTVADTVDLELRLTPTPLLLDTIRVSTARAARPPGAGEQLIRGRLLDDENGEAVAYGLVRLLWAGSSVASVITREDGSFRLVSPRAGTYRLRAERMGYTTAESEDLYLELGDTLTVELHLAVDAVPLEPLTVTASARPWEGRTPLVGMEAFFLRYSRYSGSGFGDFVTRDSIAVWEDRVQTTGHMLRWTTHLVRQVEPRTGQVTLRGGCEPTYYLNGTMVPYDNVEALSPT
ncbi:MAG TPA: carboxypeptidase-like regulatory domain-containing protein, partial [Longimicrobiales bacterium]|nr:carboxypeptidase-like regulatory domain-containing protein [Longimicrobiales bacterium]